MSTSNMVGRTIQVRGQRGVVTQWEPLGSGMCDALIRFDGGHLCWYASHELRPVDGAGPLPTRADARSAAKAVQLEQLRNIRAQHVRDFAKPWPGMEHGKAIVGQAIDGAILDLTEKS